MKTLSRCHILCSRMQHLMRVYTVFSGLFVQILRINTVHCTTRATKNAIIISWSVWSYAWYSFNLLPLPGLAQQKTNRWYFSYFCQEIGIGISWKLSPLETICMKCQILFPGKNKKNILKCHLMKILPRVLSVNLCSLWKNSAEKRLIFLSHLLLTQHSG